MENVLLPNLMKSWSHKIECLNYSIILKFDRHLTIGTAKMLVKFQSDCTAFSSYPMATRFCKILQLDMKRDLRLKENNQQNNLHNHQEGLCQSTEFIACSVYFLVQSCVQCIIGPNRLTLYVLNFSKATQTYIYILCHFSTLIWRR